MKLTYLRNPRLIVDPAHDLPSCQREAARLALEMDCVVAFDYGPNEYVYQPRKLIAACEQHMLGVHDDSPTGGDKVPGF